MHYSVISSIYNDVRNTKTYACNRPSNISKYRLNTTGRPTGSIILRSSIITKAPNTLPKSRIQSESGFVTTSRMFIGVTIATGSTKIYEEFLELVRNTPNVCLDFAPHDEG